MSLQLLCQPPSSPTAWSHPLTTFASRRVLSACLGVLAPAGLLTHSVNAAPVPCQDWKERRLPDGSTLRFVGLTRGRKHRVPPQVMMHLYPILRRNPNGAWRRENHIGFSAESTVVWAYRVSKEYDMAPYLEAELGDGRKLRSAYASGKEGIHRRRVQGWLLPSTNAPSVVLVLGSNPSLKPGRGKKGFVEPISINLQLK